MPRKPATTVDETAEVQSVEDEVKTEQNEVASTDESAETSEPENSAEPEEPVVDESADKNDERSSKEDSEPASETTEARVESNETAEVTTEAEPVEESKSSEKVEKVEPKTEDASAYPKQYALKRPTTIYRAPAGSFAGRSFGGTLIITGPDKDGFTPVRLNRGGVGVQNGYVKTSDLI